MVSKLKQGAEAEHLLRVSVTLLLDICICGYTYLHGWVKVSEGLKVSSFCKLI